MFDFLPLLTLALLLVGAFSLPFARRYWPQRSNAVSAAISLLAGLTWLLGRSSLPWQQSTGSPIALWPAAPLPPLYAWHVDEPVWLLSGALLLLLVAGFLPGVVNLAGASPDWRQSSLLFLLTAAGLLSLWAETMANLLAGWLLLAALWGMLLLVTLPSGRTGVVIKRASLLLAAPFFLWLAAAGIPDGDAALSLLPGEPDWSHTAVLWALLAVCLQMGVFPFHFWRFFDNGTPTQTDEGGDALASHPENASEEGASFPPATALAVQVTPALVGAGLFVRLLAAGEVGLGHALLLTGVGLISLLAGAVFAWIHMRQQGRLITALLLAQSSLLLLTGTWAGASALLAEAIVLAAAAAVFYLTRLLPGAPAIPVTISRLLAAAALAGLPLFAAFSGRAALYNGWLAHERYLLLPLAALIHLLLFIAAFSLVKSDATLSLSALLKDEAGRWRLPAGRHGWARAVLVVWPALLLIGWRSGWGAAAPLSWLFLLLPLVGLAAWLWYEGQARERLREARAVMRQTLPANLPWQRLRQSLQALLAATTIALRQAAAVLEGESGALWLLFLMAAFWLAMTV